MYGWKILSILYCIVDEGPIEDTPQDLTMGKELPAPRPLSPTIDTDMEEDSKHSIGDNSTGVYYFIILYLQ